MPLTRTERAELSNSLPVPEQPTQEHRSCEVRYKVEQQAGIEALPRQRTVTASASTSEPTPPPVRYQGRSARASAGPGQELGQGHDERRPSPPEEQQQVRRLRRDPRGKTDGCSSTRAYLPPRP